MNILILNWRDILHPLSGGAEIVTMEHTKRWVKMGHHVTWFTSWYKGAKKEEIVNGVRMIRRAGSLTVYPAAIVFILLHSCEFDVVVDEVHGFPFFSVLFTKKPVIVFIHEIAGEIWDFMYPFPINVIGKFVEKHYFWFYRHSLFWTDAPSTVEELVKRGVRRKQCTAIPCPIIFDTTLLVHSSLFPDDQKLKIRNQKSIYIFVSRVVKMKGIEEVIKAFAFIQKEQPEARLWIVGGGQPDYIDILTSMIAEYGVKDHVVFYGKVTEAEKYDLMRKAHILLHASVKEGWGLVVLEAAYVGTPAVVYNVAGLCDVVQKGKTGIVLSENTPHEMAREAIRLINNKRLYTEFQKNGKKWVSSLHWDDMAKRSLEIFQKAIPR